MLPTLRSLHDNLLACIREHELFCEAGVPNETALAPLRWRFALAARRRMDHLINTVFPAIIDDATLPSREVAALVANTPAYRQAAAAHVAAWPPEEIARNWECYSRAAKEFRASVRRRVAEEQAVIYPLLAHVPQQRAAAEKSRADASR